MLGLSGPVERARLRELLAGRVAVENDALRSTTRHDAQNRIGIDLTFSAPKSVSLQALVGGDARIIEAHDRAVARAVEVAEERAQARKKVAGQSHVEDTKNLVVAKFRHETSREQDPQLHTHALVLNLTRRSDGEWRALRNDEIVKATATLVRRDTTQAERSFSNSYAPGDAIQPEHQEGGRDPFGERLGNPGLFVGARYRIRTCGLRRRSGGH
jgi:conjugative relaxase-like TrwC/TraI family protein